METLQSAAIHGRQDSNVQSLRIRELRQVVPQPNTYSQHLAAYRQIFRTRTAKSPSNRGVWCDAGGMQAPPGTLSVATASNGLTSTRSFIVDVYTMLPRVYALLASEMQTGRNVAKPNMRTTPAQRVFCGEAVACQRANVGTVAGFCGFVSDEPGMCGEVYKEHIRATKLRRYVHVGTRVSLHTMPIGAE